MSLRDRIKRLEQSHGVDKPHELIVLIMYNARREPTEAEIEAQKKITDWRGMDKQDVLWNGERFSEIDDYREADNPLTEAKLAERDEKRLAEIRGGQAARAKQKLIDKINGMAARIEGDINEQYS